MSVNSTERFVPQRILRPLQHSNNAEPPPATTDGFLFAANAAIMEPREWPTKTISRAPKTSQIQYIVGVGIQVRIMRLNKVFAQRTAGTGIIE
jgi:hypothetical protein